MAETTDWSEFEWRNRPPAERIDGSILEVTTGPETDFWQKTSYGFIHDDGHFLGTAVPNAASIEVTFRAALTHRFDQAGLMLRASPDTWIKAGVELSDGVLNASAVVTSGWSDWNVAPLPGLAPEAPITIRASRFGDAVTLRYGFGDEPPRQLLRVAHVPPDLDMEAGPMCCSPTRAGLVVRFDPVRIGPPDARLHEEPEP